MGIDESGAHRPLGEINYSCCGWSAHRTLNLRNPVAFDEDFGRSGQRIGETVKHMAARQNEYTHV